MDVTKPENPFIRFLAGLGPLRIMLGLATLVLIAFAPDPAVPTQKYGWGLITTAVLPALGPMVFMVVLLDALMARVLMIDKQGAERQRYRRALWFNLALAAGLLLSWVPMLLHLASLA